MSNTAWDKYSFLWKLTRCEVIMSRERGKCILCGLVYPLGCYKCADSYVASSLVHFIEHHDHKPANFEIGIVNAAYDEKMKYHRSNEEKYKKMKQAEAKLAKL